MFEEVSGIAAVTFATLWTIYILLKEPKGTITMPYEVSMFHLGDTVAIDGVKYKIIGFEGQTTIKVKRPGLLTFLQMRIGNYLSKFRKAE